VISYQAPKARSSSNPSPIVRSAQPASATHHHSTSKSLAPWSLSQVPVSSPAQNQRSSPFASRSSAKIDWSAIQFQPVSPFSSRGQADGSLEDLSDDQDSLAPSVFERKPTGRGIHIRVNGGNPGGTPDYPDGIRWMQTIETSAPLFGQSSPYVDFIPPRDNKPFYFSDAGETATFSDNPSRTANGIQWDATLSLVGVSGRVVTRIDSVKYGFAIDTTGNLSLHSPATMGVGSLVVHGDTLRSEYPDWVFSGGFAVAQVPGPAGPTTPVAPGANETAQA